MSSAAGSGTPKWPGDHAEKHRQAALLGWARKRGFTRDTVKRGRRKETNPARMSMRSISDEIQAINRTNPQPGSPGWQRRYDLFQERNRYAREGRRTRHASPSKAPPSRGMELARQVRVSAQRTRPAAHPDYSPHAGNVARLTLMHELGMEQDAAKRAKIRRELRKLGVPSDQIPKEPRKPRAPREGSAAVSQPKPKAAKPAAGTRQNTPGLVPVKHIEGHVMSFSGLLDPYYLHELYGPAQFHRALDGYSATRLREAVQVVQERNPGTHPRGHSKPALIAYIMAHVGGEGAER